MRIGEFDLVNDEKVNRAIYGAVTSGGKLKGGVGENATDDAKLAQYDKLGGLILKGSNKVKIGSFFDFDTGKKREKPEVVFVFRDLAGNVVEVPDGEEIPIEVKAAEISKTVVKKVKKIKKSIEDDD